MQEYACVRTSTTVPNLSGMTASQAASSLKSKNLNINIEDFTRKIKCKSMHENAKKKNEINT